MTWLMNNWKWLIVLAVLGLATFCCCGPVALGAVGGGTWFLKPDTSVVETVVVEKPVEVIKTVEVVKTVLVPADTPVPAHTPEAPAPVVKTDINTLDYQDDDADGCAASTHPDDFPACWLQKVQDGYVSPSNAIKAIQQLAARNNIPTFDNWTSLNADPHASMLVWCPAGDGTFIPDTARPLEDPRLEKRWHNTVGIIQPHPASDPAAIRTVTCPSHGWAVPLK
jgi:hypothetical protein